MSRAMRLVAVAASLRAATGCVTVEVPSCAASSTATATATAAAASTQNSVQSPARLSALTLVLLVTWSP
jgi:hypothetical protein